MEIRISAASNKCPQTHKHPMILEFEQAPTRTCGPSNTWLGPPIIMAQEGKKISFGFSKLSKKANIFQKPITKQKNVQLIDCLEAKTIKIKGAVKKEVKGPLVIPMVQSSGSWEERRKELKIKHEIKTEKDFDKKPELELTEDEIAARELIKDVQNTGIKREGKILTLPAVAEDVIKIDGKEEPTLEDYENIPISDYGMAMLRGMGWTEGSGIGKNNKSATKVVEPDLRPKGMGLGADKSANQKYSQKPPVDKNGEELILKKGAYAKIVDGKQKGCYCEIQGFDDEAGRIIVKTTLQGLILSLNEFLIQPVTKEEYIKSSKVLNNVKYEEYKSRAEHKEIKGSSSKDKVKSEAYYDKKKTFSKVSQRINQKTYDSSSADSADERISKHQSYENGKESSHHRNKSKKKYRSSSQSSSESNSRRRKHRERTRSSSFSDYEKEKDSKNSKAKEKKYKNSSNSDSDHKSNRNRKTHKTRDHKHRHHGKNR